MQGARAIKASRAKHLRGKTVFLKTRKMVYWESTLERDFVRWSDYDPAIVDIEHQPLCLGYNYQHRALRYFPDYKLRDVEGRITIVEIKLLSKVNLPSNRIKYEVARRYCVERGWDFKVFTEQEIRPSKFFQKNIKKLRGLGHESVSFDMLQYVCNRLDQSGPSSIAQLQDLCSDIDPEDYFKSLYKLLYIQEIQVDIIGSKISLNSIVF